jgi:hypothetical protein
MAFRPTLMNWRLIFLLSLLGIAMGLASVFGLARGSDWLLWLCVGIFSAWTFARRADDELFLHGFYLGILDGVFNSTVEALFVPTYLLNNPRMVDALNDLPQGLHPTLVILIMGPIVGTVTGVAFGILAVVAGKIVRRKSPDLPSV